jgi:hypothetical protein
MSNSIDKFPDRIRYYLLDWKEKHSEEFMRMFPQRNLRDLLPSEIRALFTIVVEQDRKQIANI